MILTRLNLPGLAALALTAALYHLLNHAVFKGLLFLCAGSVQKGTGTLNLEKLGGLIKTMPWTAGFFLVGAMGISALPPLNGFVSEWLLLQALFTGGQSVPGLPALYLALAAAAIALTGGLTAACFVKAFGITFLALPRSQEAAEAREAPRTMIFGMAFLAAAVVCLGLLGPTVFNVLATVAGSICRAAPPPAAFLSSDLTICFVLALGSGLAIGHFSNGQKVRVGRTWACGYYETGSRNEYTATAFSKPFRIAFSFFLLPFRKTEKVKDSFYHVKSFVYETYTTKIFKEYLYDAGLGLVLRGARFFKRAQAGSIHLYLSYILATLVLLALLVRAF
jgi:hydrogenase-4 component B